MFFTRIGIILAYLGFGGGVFRVALALYFAVTTENRQMNAAISQRYFRAENTGAVINEGMTWILVFVALGILCEISKNNKARKLDADA